MINDKQPKGERRDSEIRPLPLAEGISKFEVGNGQVIVWAPSFSIFELRISALAGLKLVTALGRIDGSQFRGEKRFLSEK